MLRSFGDRPRDIWMHMAPYFSSDDLKTFLVAAGSQIGEGGSAVERVKHAAKQLKLAFRAEVEDLLGRALPVSRSSWTRAQLVPRVVEVLIGEVMRMPNVHELALEDIPLSSLQGGRELLSLVVELRKAGTDQEKLNRILVSLKGLRSSYCSSIASCLVQSCAPYYCEQERWDLYFAIRCLLVKNILQDPSSLPAEHRGLFCFLWGEKERALALATSERQRELFTLLNRISLFQGEVPVAIQEALKGNYQALTSNEYSIVFLHLLAVRDIDGIKMLLEYGGGGEREILYIFRVLCLTQCFELALVLWTKASLEYVESVGALLLEEASALGRKEIVECVLQERFISGEAKGRALIVAAKGGHAEVAECVLKEEVVSDEAKGRALIAAAKGGHAGIVEMLWSKGTISEVHLDMAIKAAQRAGQKEIVRNLSAKKEKLSVGGWFSGFIMLSSAFQLLSMIRGGYRFGS